MNKLDKEMAGIGRMITRDHLVRVGQEKWNNYSSLYQCLGAMVNSAYEFEDQLYVHLKRGELSYPPKLQWVELGLHNARFTGMSSAKIYAIPDWKKIKSNSDNSFWLIEEVVRRGIIAEGIPHAEEELKEINRQSLETKFREIQDIANEINKKRINISNGNN